MKKFANIIITIEIVVITLLSVLLIIRKKEPQTSKYISPYDSRITMGQESSTQEIATQTGAINEDSYTQEEIKFGELLDSLPITTNKFEMKIKTVDFPKIKVVVTIFPPYENNLEEFKSWLDKNGYGDLNPEYFIIYSK